MKYLRALILLGLCLAPGSLLAEDLELDGFLRQGSIVFGKTDPKAEVTLDGRSLRLTEDGRFVFGFGRDFAPGATLKVHHSDGRVVERVLAIEKREYQIQRIDGLPDSKVTPPEDVWERIQKENAKVKAARAVDRPDADFLSGWQWPAKGIISGVYGSQRILNGNPRRPHFGVDVAAPTGTPVVAPADGIVTLSEPDLYFSGGTVILDHGHGLSSSFLHLHELLVEPGQKIKRGEVIATIGATGRVTGAHLDWRMNWYDERVDPTFLVPPMPPSGEGEGG